MQRVPEGTHLVLHVRPPEPPPPFTDKARPSARRPCPCLTRPLRVCVPRWQIAEHPYPNDAQRVTRKQNKKKQKKRLRNNIKIGHVKNSSIVPKLLESRIHPLSLTPVHCRLFFSAPFHPDKPRIQPPPPPLSCHALPCPTVPVRVCSPGACTEHAAASQSRGLN